MLLYSVSHGKPIIPRSEKPTEISGGVCQKRYGICYRTGRSGKTYTAIALAVRALKNKEIKKIILSRPAVEAGEKVRLSSRRYER